MKPVTDISVTYDVALVTVDNLPVNMNIISEIFSSIAQKDINIDMISQAPPYRGVINLSFSIHSDDIPKTIETLNNYKKKVPELMVEINSHNTKLTVSGANMKNLPGVAARLFTILAKNGINVKLITTSETDISYLVYDEDVDKAIDSISKEYNISLSG